MLIFESLITRVKNKCIFASSNTLPFHYYQELGKATSL